MIIQILTMTAAKIPTIRALSSFIFKTLNLRDGCCHGIRTATPVLIPLVWASPSRRLTHQRHPSSGIPMKSPTITEGHNPPNRPAVSIESNSNIIFCHFQFQPSYFLSDALLVSS